jgi:hypothetical protein
MNFAKTIILFGLLTLFPAIAVAQNIVANPTATQTITQPSGTALNVNRLENIRFADQFGSIQAAINDAPAGGTVLVPPGYTETLSANLNINKSIVIRFEGSATINQGSNQVIVPAGTTNVSIISDFPLNGNTSVAPVLFTGYNGSTAAFQIGSGGSCVGPCSDPVNNVSNFYMKGIRVDASNICPNTPTCNAPIIKLSRIQQFWLDGSGVNASIGCGAQNGCGSATGVIGILIDGTGNFSGIGRIDFPIINIGTNPNGSANSVAIRVQNVTTHTLIIGGHIQMAGNGTVCFDVNGGNGTSSELTFYAPNCEAATTALTVEGHANVQGDLRTDSGVSKYVNFGSGTNGNRIRFLNSVAPPYGSGTVIDNGIVNSVNFADLDESHADLWQLFQSSYNWAVTNKANSKSCLEFNQSGNAWINACGGASLHVNEGVGGTVYFYNGATSPLAYIDNYGNAQFNGNLTVGGTKSFRINHPLDPEKKYLYHAAVESPDMKNIYDGVVTLGAKGSSIVKLPGYFEALNKDFRYQLTCIGGSAPVYVAREIRNNRFVIAGGRPGLKVSWQVTGIRHDAYANAHRMVVEQEKSVEDSLHSPDSIPSAEQKPQVGNPE